MDQPTIDRLLSTLESNAEANTKLAVSVDGMVMETRALSVEVAASTNEVKRLCATQRAQVTAKAKTSALMWSVVKHPSTILATAFALWFAATVFGITGQQVVGVAGGVDVVAEEGIGE